MKILSCFLTILLILITSSAIGRILVNRSSGYCLDTDGRAVNGGKVRMWYCATHPNQLWEITNTHAGRYKFKNKASGLCLDTNGQAVNGGAVRMCQPSESSLG
ncbi:MAG: RICIN domain-containing protein [Gammaproteobacteria bacterium]|nr:RICIN domain-containing protein [Gammaproteobacteria bacterium]